MFSRLITRKVHTEADIIAFFERAADGYAEQHGHPDDLLAYRLDLIRKQAQFRGDEVVLDVGCGTGHHLLGLAGRIGRGIGIDFSPAMVTAANARLRHSEYRGKLNFRVDHAARLSTVEDKSVDVALCIGSIEHMLDQAAVLRNVYRVLKPGGRFVCLTPDRNYVWYRYIALAVEAAYKHLSTDRFLTSQEIMGMLVKSGLAKPTIGYWAFIPKGDLHPAVAIILQALDGLGKLLGITSLRGGLLVYARKEREARSSE